MLNKKMRWGIWAVFWRIGVAVSLLATWVGIITLPGAIRQVPEAVRDWERLMPFSRETVLIWFSLILVFWVVWIDLRPLVLHWAKQHFVGPWLRIFDVKAVFVSHVTEQPERLEIICLIKFRRRLKNPLMSVRVISPLQTRPQSHVVAKRRLEEVVRDTELRLRLGSSMISGPGWSACHSLWGEELGTPTLQPDQVSIIRDAKSLVELTIGHQTYRIFAHSLPINQNDKIIYLITEDELPLLLSPPNTEQRTQP